MPLDTLSDDLQRSLASSSTIERERTCSGMSRLERSNRGEH